VSDEKAGANVVPLPVAPIGSLDAVTVRVPKALVELIALLYPNASFEAAVSILAREVDDLRNMRQSANLALAENGNLKNALGEMMLRVWLHERQANERQTDVQLGALPAGATVQ
jgi:hypothetical protein